jgi:hypothetical protein
MLNDQFAVAGRAHIKLISPDPLFLAALEGEERVFFKLEGSPTVGSMERLFFVCLQCAERYACGNNEGDSIEKGRSNHHCVFSSKM